LINADKPHLWKADIAASVDLFNTWFMLFAPEAYRTTRVKTTEHVKEALLHTADLLRCTPSDLKARPDVLPVLGMSTAPPIARDRLAGLAGTTRNLVGTLESGRLPSRMPADELDRHMQGICHVITRLLDRDIFPWLESDQVPSDEERTRAATIVADRLCGAVADPIVRNAQEQRQLALIEEYLSRRGYTKKPHPTNRPLTEMELGTFAFRMNVVVGRDVKVNIPMEGTSDE